MKLFSRELGQGRPLLILHGLFGSSDNWHSLSRVFADHFKVFVIDQRNHGQSPHHEQHDYDALTEDVHEFITARLIEDPIILGHSMGGKTAMSYAIKYPDKLSRLIVVDIVPKPYPRHHDSILEGLKTIDLKKLGSRREADQILSQFVPEPDVRQFLLKNLARDQYQNFEWRINIPVLEKHIEDMGAGIIQNGKFMGPTLFITGKRSNYFNPGDERIIHNLFPSAVISPIDTGHWVQAEKPKEFTKIVFDFLQVSS